MSLIVIDGNNFLHRCTSIPELGILHHNNIPVGGIYGFINTLKHIVHSVPKTNNTPTKVIVVWDGRRSTRRLSVYPEYKQNRNKLHEHDYAEYMQRFFIQQKILREQFLPALGVCNITNLDREGDDVVYLICSMYNYDNNLFVISEDKDMLQLVAHFPNLTIYRPITKQTINNKNFESQLDIKPEHYLIYKALKGDASDNITGVPLIGPKTASKILKECNPSDFNAFFVWIQGQYQKEALKRKETRISGIYKNWGVFTRNLELIDLSREEFSNHEQVEISTVIDRHKPQYYEEYFLNCCNNYGLEQLIRDKEFIRVVFSNT